jgi:hypothetical protein
VHADRARAAAVARAAASAVRLRMFLLLLLVMIRSDIVVVEPFSRFLRAGIHAYASYITLSLDLSSLFDTFVVF